MEQLQIHSRSYIVRWINVNPYESISWSLQPHKKSLNFGIFKHVGGKAGVSPTLPQSATLDGPDESSKPRRNSSAKDRDAAASGVIEKLQGMGLKCMEWHGKCEADQVSMGRYDVHEGDEGMFGLVIDNTFSKTVAKTATFVLMTHPTKAPPKSGAQLRYNQPLAAGSTSTVGASPSLRATNASSESLPHDIAANGLSQKISRRPSAMSLANSFYTGIMHKKRRKKNQGYARRFFSLDFTSSTLSYYRSSHASALRGSVPLSLAAIIIDEKRKEFSIDSGAEVWHLRLRNKKDFDNWRQALERATATPPAQPAREPPSADSEVMSPIQFGDPMGEREWHRVEELISRVSGSRDAMRRLAHDTDPRGATNGSISPATSPVDRASYFPEVPEKESQKLPFWKRKPSSSGERASPASILRRSFSAQGTATPGASPAQAQMPLSPLPKIRTPTQPGASADDIHERCLALLRDLDATVTAFSSLLAGSKARRKIAASKSASRMSMESTRSDEFVDAVEKADDNPQMLDIRTSDDNTEHDDFYSDEESVTSSDAGDHLRSPVAFISSPPEDQSLFPSIPKQLVPAGALFVQGRPSIPAPRQPPPSIIGFLRKNAGKDLSTVAMPVTANEPTSLLQRLAEPLESAHLLSTAASATEEVDRLIAVAAFAVATIASNRVKERAIRKPFNPMLGETFEFVRHEDFEKSQPAYRFVAEKVTHHPVRMTWQADSLDGKWSLAQTPRPVQKFWGKSVELNTEGPFRLTLPATSSSQANCASPPSKSTTEHYSWTAPTAYLRNVIAGEKYVEPVGSINVINETTGAKAVATFKASGMFSGRSEDVTITFSSSDVAVTGKWTSSLTRSDTGATVWEAGPLVPDASKNWGFTSFAAKLNEVTDVEEGKIPVTDSRLRPDQRALEEGNLDKAEGIKARLEERQRARRKVVESHGGVHKARWFEKVEGNGGDEEVWKLKVGGEGYWECREKGRWPDVQEVFEV